MGATSRPRPADPPVLLGKWWTAFFPGPFIMITAPVPQHPSEAPPTPWSRPLLRRSPRSIRIPTARPTSLLLDPRLRLRRAGRESLQVAWTTFEVVEEKRTDRFEASFEATPLESMTQHRSSAGDVNVVDHVLSRCAPARPWAPVGESGCGSRSRPLTIMGPIDPRLRLRAKSLRGREPAGSPLKSAAPLGHEMAMIYQDALSSLNPAMRIGAQMK